MSAEDHEDLSRLPREAGDACVLLISLDLDLDWETFGERRETGSGVLSESA